MDGGEFTRHVLKMSTANRFLQRPWLASIIPPRNLERLSRNTTFASCRPSPLVLSRSLGTKPPSPPSPEPNIISAHAHTHFKEGNLPYVDGFKDKGKLAIPPAKHLAIGPFSLCWAKQPNK